MDVTAELSQHHERKKTDFQSIYLHLSTEHLFNVLKICICVRLFLYPLSFKRRWRNSQMYIKLATIFYRNHLNDWRHCMIRVIRNGATRLSPIKSYVWRHKCCACTDVFIMFSHICRQHSKCKYKIMEAVSPVLAATSYIDWGHHITSLPWWTISSSPKFSSHTDII